MLEVAIIVLLTMVGGGWYGFTVFHQYFRRRLQRELPLWIKEGILHPFQAERLRTKYRLNCLAVETRALLLHTLFGLGSLLIAGGAVAFMAAHWGGLSKYARFSIVTILMMATYGFGFFFWKQKMSLSVLGHALVIAGTLVFGADIGLSTQIFHLDPLDYHGFLLWSIGVLGMAYAGPSVPLAILATIASFVWQCGHCSYYPGSWTAFAYLLFYLPALLTFGFVFQSRVSHFFTLLFWDAAILVFLADPRIRAARIVMVAALLLVLLYWFYGEFIQQRDMQDIGADGKALSILLLDGIGYYLSFYNGVRFVLATPWSWQSSPQLLVNLMIAAGVLLAIGVSLNKKIGGSKLPTLILPGIATILLIMAGLFPLKWVVVGTVLGNLAAAGLGFFLVWWGHNALDRWYFWQGLILLVLIILGRFFEYTTELLWKSLAYVIAGLLLIGGGLWFERDKEGNSHG